MVGEPEKFGLLGSRVLKYAKMNSWSSISVIGFCNSEEKQNVSSYIFFFSFGGEDRGRLKENSYFVK